VGLRCGDGVSLGEVGSGAPRRILNPQSVCYIIEPSIFFLSGSVGTHHAFQYVGAPAAPARGDGRTSRSRNAGRNKEGAVRVYVIGYASGWGWRRGATPRRSALGRRFTVLILNNSIFDCRNTLPARSVCCALRGASART
jgi:hypothetical protein